MANLTFDEDLSTHKTDRSLENDYSDILQMIGESHSNITNLSVFGFGAKTSAHSKKSTPMFPLTRNIRNPFVPNQPDLLKETYHDCLDTLEMSLPVHLDPLFGFIK